MIRFSSMQASRIDIDDSDTWTEQDQLDLAAFSMQYAVTAFFEEGEVTE